MRARVLVYLKKKVLDTQKVLYWLSQIQQLKKTHTFITSQFLGVRNPGHGLAGSFASLCLTCLQSRCWQGWGLIQKLTGEGSASKLVWLLAEFSSLRATRMRVCSWLAVDWKLPSVPGHVGTTWQHIPCQLTLSRKQRDFATKTDVSIFCKVIMEMIAHHLCCILLFGSNSLDQPTLEGRGLFKCLKTRRQRSCRAILGVRLPQVVISC